MKDEKQEARLKVVKRLQLASVQLAKAVETAVRGEVAIQELFELSSKTCRIQEMYVKGWAGADPVTTTGRE